MVSIEMQVACHKWLDDVEAEIQRLHRTSCASHTQNFDRYAALVLAQSYLSFLLELSHELQRTEPAAVLKGGSR